MRQWHGEKKERSGISAIFGKWPGDETDEQIDEFLRTVRDHPPVLVHGYNGQKRVGVMAAAYRVAFENWSVEEAMIELGNLGGDSSGGRGAKAVELLNRAKANRTKWFAPVSQPASQPASKP